MARIKGNNNPNRLTGSKNNDDIYGYGGDDELFGLAGHDTIYAGDGSDRVWGGIGDDRAWGEADNDFIYGEGGNDRLTGGLGDDELHGGDGSDNLHGDANHELPNWHLELTGGTDWLYGGAGNDAMIGQFGGDHLWGGSGADQFGYNQPSNSHVQTGVDRIYDFNPTEGDLIYISNAVDADPEVWGLQKYQYVEARIAGQANVGTLSAFDSDGNGTADSTRLDLYADGDDIPEVTIELVGYVPGENPIAGMTDVFFV